AMSPYYVPRSLLVEAVAIRNFLFQLRVFVDEQLEKLVQALIHHAVYRCFLQRRLNGFRRVMRLVSLFIVIGKMLQVADDLLVTIGKGSWHSSIQDQEVGNIAGLYSAS
ncbi:hypothetical protein, partial [Klebsiella pneumoniae]|uniref:hypothetical protein n=1 Tax=Klebsiella pneumoniae TaxID=573 RepID=UPI0021753688